MGGYWYKGEWIIGETIQLSVNDPGLIYGATIFTTLRVYESLEDPRTHWQQHHQRLLNGIAGLGWTEPNWSYIFQGVLRVSQHYPVVRITLFQDGRELILGRHLPEHLLQFQTSGIQAWIAEPTLYRRSLAAFKTGNYLGAWLALQAAKQLGANEAILLDDQGHWLETATGNLWGWANNTWYTPPADDQILPGVMRSHLIQSLKTQNIVIQEIPWDAQLIAQLQVIAYSNSVVEVVPITEIIDQDLPSLDPENSPIKTLQAIAQTAM